ncbi:MAG: NAD(+) kinase [Gammaproteobacteria bacterium]|nr:NAD(+) kinase [Gammaproteobacteria bacterium]MCP5418758.1 NAD(+) kinase [Chromatiaceae bacterium]
MALQFQTIGLIGKLDAPTPNELLLQLQEFLLSNGQQVLLEASTASKLPGHQMEVADLGKIGRICDLAIVVGGDGTLLHTARNLADYHVPLVGINLGRLGFLVDISPDEMVSKLTQIFAGHYQEDRRFLLHAEINGTTSTAFNDVVIHKWNTARMIEFETYIDGSFVDAQRSDGMIISTPTGSTAYALSGGGPLLAPDLNATVIVPICPHTLSNRPLVVAGESLIEVVVCGKTELEHVRVTCDGQTSLEVQRKAIRIRKHHCPARLIHPPGHDHFKVLRNKLSWSGHPTYPK